MVFKKLLNYLLFSTKNFTEGPLGDLAIHKNKSYFFLVSKYKTLLQELAKHNSFICDAVSFFSNFDYMS